MHPLIELKNVFFSYGAMPVLENINLHLHAGQFAALVGPSGAGKSTLLKLVLAVMRPSQGHVQTHPQSTASSALGDQPRKRIQIGYIPQLESVDLSFPVNVEQVVLMGRVRNQTRPLAQWLPWHDRADRIQLREVLQKLEIDTLAKRHIRELSGGQLQRVFLARALISQPDILVLDEPTSGVDARTAQNVMHQIAELNRTGMSILMTTHDLNLAAAHVPWVIALNRVVIAEGTPDAVFTEEVLNKTYNADMMVIRQGHHIFIQERPHGHSWRDLVPEPVLGHS